MRKYNENHYWIEEYEDNKFRVGFTSYKLSHLGALNVINFPQIDTLLIKDHSFGDFESTKSNEELIAPLSGLLSWINTKIVNDPESYDLMSVDVELFEITASNLLELEDFLDFETYQSQLG